MMPLAAIPVPVPIPIAIAIDDDDGTRSAKDWISSWGRA